MSDGRYYGVPPRGHDPASRPGQPRQTHETFGNRVPQSDVYWTTAEQQAHYAFAELCRELTSLVRFIHESIKSDPSSVPPSDDRS